MKAILSCTQDDLYLFNLPFAIHSWRKLGIECIVICPVSEGGSVSNRLKLITDIISFDLHFVSAPEEKAATYAQCSRLYAAAIPGISPAEVLITSDADMCVFNGDFWGQFEHTAWINVIGSDLVPPSQFPMCYISMPAAGWNSVMEIEGRSVQQCLDDLLGHIEADHFRGNYWGKDQETIYNQIVKMDPDLKLTRGHNRASPGTQFATRRADRDGWPESVPKDIIDAHLPRPGTRWENFIKTVSLFDQMHPGDNHDWMVQYAEEYLMLIK